jgi:hypothetical protein
LLWDVFGGNEGQCLIKIAKGVVFWLTEKVGNGKKKHSEDRQGGMAEWFKAAVLKTAFLPGNGGSNPSPSAIHTNIKQRRDDRAG